MAKHIKAVKILIDTYFVDESWKVGVLFVKPFSISSVTAVSYKSQCVDILFRVDSRNFRYLILCRL